MPGANYFILVIICAIIYNGAYIGEINSNNLSAAMFWFNIEHIGIPLQHYFWAIMSLEYVRLQKKKIKIAKYVLLYHPIMYLLIFYTNNIHHKYISAFYFQSNGHFQVVVTDKGVLYTVVVISGTILALVSTTFYIRGYIRASRFHKYGYVIMIIASLFPWISVYLTATNNSYLGIDYYPVSTTISGTLYLLGIFQFRIFDTIPIATETIFRQSKEGILLSDLTDHIVEVNKSFLSIYPEFNQLSRKYTLNAFLEQHSEFSDMLIGKNKLQYKLMNNNEEKYYSAEITKILTEDGFQIGKILTINDITLFIEHQKKLELIVSDAVNKAEANEIFFLQAQIKPHFLSNTLSVIASMVTRNPNAAKNLIVDLSEYLMKCYYFEDTTGMVSLMDELETIQTYIAIEKARFMERLNFTVISDEVSRLNIPRLILQPLVENAIRHGILKKAEGGNVYLKILLEGRKILFQIIDDGVGMSEEKVKLLVEGNENNRGISISNINKRLKKYYGEGLKIISEDGKGTTISFYVPYNISD